MSESPFIEEVRHRTGLLTGSLNPGQGHNLGPENR